MTKKCAAFVFTVFIIIVIQTDPFVLSANMEQGMLKPTSFFAHGQLVVPARCIADYFRVPLHWNHEEGCVYIEGRPLEGLLLAGVFYVPAAKLAASLGVGYAWQEESGNGFIFAGERVVYLNPIQAPEFNEDRPIVYLTFDDGPNENIPAILAMLDIFDIKATFFLIGENVRRYPVYAKDIVAAGHQIGNHSYSHPRLPKLSAEEMTQELVATEEVFEEVLGFNSRLFRPPYGYYNEEVIEISAGLGLRQIMWDINPEDFREPGTEELVEIISEGLRPSAKILLHCKMGTAKALPAIIDLIWSKGFMFATFPE